MSGISTILQREAMIALQEKMDAVDGDPIYELFGVGGEGMLSHGEVAAWIRALRVGCGLESEPTPAGWWTRALDAYEQARAAGEDVAVAAKRFKLREASRAIAVKVVLSNGEDDELDLGTFSQGVVVSHLGVVDVASDKTIASTIGNEWIICRDTYCEECQEYHPDDQGPYAKLFVHGATTS